MGVSGTPWKVHVIASTLSCHRTLRKLRQQVCGLEVYQLTGGRGSRSAGISIPAAARRSWTRFPTQRLSGNLYVPGYLHGKVSTLLSRQAFHQECGGRRPTTFRIELKQSPNPGSEGRDAPVRGAFAVSCPCCYGQNGGSLLLLLLLSRFSRDRLCVTP